ncbi:MULTISPECIES: 16S rRNA (cytidine(1402)-2'-O)-methyltransferase [Halocynthiibacter]|uniref:Ribosomal RNA small subunit methyltransferase I n=1 Tax=Halocynthiibacter halioticoli TaxID=2986804 RepID=A0AAE3LPP0_9RHOB|nr:MULTISPECIES: 16S rRNA (cytidine(1402)-2'-O)-methyltransferase [Halocynthiibacter]MCV6823632.1 16S rRNA (cytidine(1402)-2'-O)-methyltransferase [Halocynthiibacter halioticoli]MCW4056633.1 16S rRNA (cytidine(1402)-2'-O)-methyltransferase [Halocynthiibacter sp. SDUM655004]
MNFETKKLASGLYFVATPIGSARDITLRALDTLASADVIAAEDTRTARRLMDIHGIPLRDRPMVAYHDHNGEKARPRLLKYLEEGCSVAYASEAGTPLVADPGYHLSVAAIEAGYPVTSAPGPSAMIAALTIAGLPTDKFLFAGFLPNAKSARRKALSAVADTDATLVFYESPKRLKASLNDMADTFGSERKAAVCRELTKKFEEVARGTLEELASAFAERTVKGEIVVLVNRVGTKTVDASSIDDALKEALKSNSVKDSASIVADTFNVARRDVYQKALAIAKDAKD